MEQARGIQPPTEQGQRDRSARRRAIAMAVVTLLVGMSVAWFFRNDLLVAFADRAGRDSRPCPPEPPDVWLRRLLLVTATSAFVFSLPTLSWLVWTFARPRSRVSPTAFFAPSYLTLAGGVCLFALLVLPAFHAVRQQQAVRPMALAYLKEELQALLVIGLLSQLCVLAIILLGPRIFSRRRT